MRLQKFGIIAGALTAAFFIIVPGFANASSYTDLNYEWRYDGIHYFTTQTLTKDKSPYLIRGGCSLGSLPSYATLTIEAGVVVKFEMPKYCFSGTPPTSINIYGNLYINGTADDPVIFTSIRDDSVGGDTNGDSTSTLPRPGDWGAIRIGSSYNTGNIVSIKHAAIRYGSNGFLGEITLSPVGDLQLQNLELSNSAGYGLASNISLTIAQSRFHDNNQGAIYEYPYNGSLIDARNNWWGDDSGPITPSNPGGKGQRFYGNVLYDPWIGKITNHPPTLSFATDSPSGISTSTIFLPSQPTFKIIYSDPDNDAPSMIHVVVNSTTYPLSLSQTPNYASGTLYSFTAPTGTFAKGVYSFYFEASDGKVTTTVVGATFRIRNIPVILIPGILGTEMKRGADTLWLNLWNTFWSPSDDFMDPLAMNGDGSPVDGHVRPGDVVRVEGNILQKFHYFDLLISEFNDVGYQENTDLFVFPYDWRLDNIYTAQKLKDKIDAVLNQTGSDKVDLAAHSMGGLVSKQYISVNGVSKIDKLIFIGTPHLGSPNAAKTLLFGDNLGIQKVISFLNELEIKSIAKNMLSIYQLLPSPAYFTKLGGYFYDLVSNNVSVFGYSHTIGYFKSWDINQNMLDQVADFHAPLDNLDLSGVKTFNIAGCKTATITKIIHRNVESIGDEYYLQMQTGDGTVPLGSADLAGSNGVENFYFKNVEHSKMPSLDNVRQLVTEIIQDKVNYSSLPVDVQTTSTGCGISGKIVSVHSPVDLNIYDADGNHVGPTSTNDIEQNIPGATYENIANNKFVFLPEDQSQIYIIKLDATATGTFSFRVEDINNDQPQQTVYYNDIGIVPQSRGQIEISASSTDTSLEFDVSGAGNFVPLNADSVLDAGQSEDYVKPTTTISVVGTAGRNGWYISTTTISLSAADDNSGILKTEYSLDNGNTWRVYLVPFSINQSRGNQHGRI